MPVMRDKSHTCMPTNHLQDKNLSLKAKGLLSIILSMSEGNYSYKELASLSSDGIASTKTALKELAENNYLESEN